MKESDRQTAFFPLAWPFARISATTIFSEPDHGSGKGSAPTQSGPQAGDGGHAGKQRVVGSPFLRRARIVPFAILLLASAPTCGGDRKSSERGGYLRAQHGVCARFPASVTEDLNPYGAPWIFMVTGYSSRSGGFLAGMCHAGSNMLGLSWVSFGRLNPA